MAVIINDLEVILEPPPPAPDAGAPAAGAAPPPPFRPEDLADVMRQRLERLARVQAR